MNMILAKIINSNHHVLNIIELLVIDRLLNNVSHFVNHNYRTISIIYSLILEQNDDIIIQPESGLLSFIHVKWASAHSISCSLKVRLLVKFDKVNTSNC